MELHSHELDIGLRARYLICYKETPCILKVHTPKKPTNICKWLRTI
jgi:hypothetical protein